MTYDQWVDAGRPHWLCRGCLEIMVTVPQADDWLCGLCEEKVMAKKNYWEPDDLTPTEKRVEGFEWQVGVSKVEHRLEEAGYEKVAEIHDSVVWEKKAAVEAKDSDRPINDLIHFSPADDPGITPVCGAKGNITAYREFVTCNVCKNMEMPAIALGNDPKMTCSVCHKRILKLDEQFTEAESGDICRCPAASVGFTIPETLRAGVEALMKLPPGTVIEGPTVTVSLPGPACATCGKPTFLGSESGLYSGDFLQTMKDRGYCVCRHNESQREHVQRTAAEYKPGERSAIPTLFAWLSGTLCSSCLKFHLEGRESRPVNTANMLPYRTGFVDGSTFTNYCTCHGDWLMADGVHMKVGDIAGSGMGEGYTVKNCTINSTNYGTLAGLPVVSADLSRITNSREIKPMIESSSIKSSRIHRMEEQLARERKAVALIDEQIQRLQTPEGRSALCDVLMPIMIEMLQRFKETGHPSPQSDGWWNPTALLDPDFVKEMRALRVAD